MSINKPQLQKLGVSAFLIAHLERDDLDSPLGYRCQPAYYWQSSPIAERGIQPLWECETKLWYFNPATNAFEECSLENIDDVWHRYSSLQSVWAELFLDVYGDDEPIDSLRDLAKKVEFRHIDRMLREIETAGDKYNEWREHFPATCS
jgi:hypothetical protein